MLYNVIFLVTSIEKISTIDPTLVKFNSKLVPRHLIKNNNKTHHRVSHINSKGCLHSESQFPALKGFPISGLQQVFFDDTLVGVSDTSVTVTVSWTRINFRIWVISTLWEKDVGLRLWTSDKHVVDMLTWAAYMLDMNMCKSEKCSKWSIKV